MHSLTELQCSSGSPANGQCCKAFLNKESWNTKEWLKPTTFSPNSVMSRQSEEFQQVGNSWIWANFWTWSLKILIQAAHIYADTNHFENLNYLIDYMCVSSEGQIENRWKNCVRFWKGTRQERGVSGKSVMKEEGFAVEMRFSSLDGEVQWLNSKSTGYNLEAWKGPDSDIHWQS